MIKRLARKINLLDNDTMHWRVRAMDRLAKRYLWQTRHRLDLSPKEKVEKISMVVVGRNDNYGGDFSDRLRATIDWNYSHLPNPELVYVEWNTIPDRPSDTEWMAKRYPNSKLYIVPTEIHQALSNNPKIPMMEYFAKNMGIREASNEWVLLVNADVFIGNNTLKHMQALNKKYVYGTHYKNILWDKKPISSYHQKDKTIIRNHFSTSNELNAVVGNFILTHRDNWALATGYDESLTDVRSGVDTNGVMQLLYLGVKPMVIGDHYHLDHNESLIKGKNATHGNTPKSADLSNIPYKNPDTWGMKSFEKEKISDNVWIVRAPK